MKNKIYNDFVTAIDIGTTKIVALVGQRQPNGKIKIIGSATSQSKGVHRGEVQNIDEASKSIELAVEAVQLKTGVIFSDVFVGVAGQYIRCIRNRGYITKESDDSEITQKDVDKLIGDMYKIPVENGEEIVHVLPQSYIVDNESGIKQPVGYSGRRLEGNFHIVIGKVETAKRIEKCMSRLGLNLKGVVLEQLASAQAVLTEEEKEAGVALIDIGGGTSDLAIYHDSIIRHTAVIPFGGNTVTNDLKEGCQILQNLAEELKKKHGSALGNLEPDNKMIVIPGINGRSPKEVSLRNLASIIQARMEEILSYVSFEIENSGFYDKLGAGIVITGGGSLLRHLPQLIRYNTGLDVKIGYPSEGMSADIDQDINNPIYSTAVGLILKGYEYYDKQNATIKTTVPKEKLEPVATIVEEVKPIAKEAKPKKTSKMSNYLKETFSSMFDEKDSEMN